MVYKLKDLCPSTDCVTQLTPNGGWFASVALPWYPGVFERIRDAWQVFRQKAVAVEYPVAGEFERILVTHGWV